MARVVMFDVMGVWWLLTSCVDKTRTGELDAAEVVVEVGEDDAVRVHKNREGRLVVDSILKRAILRHWHGAYPIAPTIEDAARSTPSEVSDVLTAQERDAWKKTAAQYARDVDYYRGLCDAALSHLGPEAHRADDGSISESPLRAKLPGLVEKLANWRCEALFNANAEIAKLQQEKAVAVTCMQWAWLDDVMARILVLADAIDTCTSPRKVELRYMHGLSPSQQWTAVLEPFGLTSKALASTAMTPLHAMNALEQAVRDEGAKIAEKHRSVLDKLDAAMRVG